MSVWDWLIVAVLNGSIIVYGIYLSRGVKTSTDWFLAGRSLPWWMVGISMYATAIDASDLIADSGGTYTLGMRYLASNWVGIVGGWALAAYWIFRPMYRAGMYTNAEYLEARFGPSSRVLAALVQVQYRTLVLAIMGRTIYLTLTIVCGWGSLAWWAVAAVAVLATVYTALGGLRSVAVTDALQFVVMTAAALLIWVLVFHRVGGFSGVEAKLAAHDPGLAANLLHGGEDMVDERPADAMDAQTLERALLSGGRYDARRQVIVQRTPAWLVAISFIIVGVAYSIVNHTQAMRMFGAKSEWDLKMSVTVAGIVMIAMTFFNLTMGVMGRALHPDMSALPGGLQDAIYPTLVREMGGVGLTGIVVAGVLAASFSTYDSIGSTLSALLTRDVYARLFVRDRTDEHYLRVGQWLTPLIIGGSFLYVPFMQGGMLLFYLDLTSCFVVPLLTLYLMGIFTPVNRRSGLVGLLVGSAYGMVRLISHNVAEGFGFSLLPAFLLNRYAAYVYSMIITAGAMVVHTLWHGWEPRGELLHQESGGWLRASQQAVRALGPLGAQSARPWVPAVLVAVVVALGCTLSFYVFW